MGQAVVIAWALLVFAINHSQGLGVNWGSIASHRLPPNIVVNMIKENGINKVKLFDADSDVLDALSGTGIEVMVGIPNEMLGRFSESYGKAKDWVKKNVTKHLKDKGGVDIRYVAVGNEPFLKTYNGSYDKTTLPALNNIQKALNEAGIGNKIKTTVPCNADVYDSSGSHKPSDGSFRKDIKDSMNQLVKFLKENNSSFVVNIYPFLSLYQSSDFPEEFAFFDDSGGEQVHDKDTSYDNVFDANYDTLVHALKKAGVPDLRIIVGEAGWPTDGDKNANVKNAKKFYDGLLKKLAKNKGTPKRPGYIEVYLFGLLDEDTKSILPGNFERHWGIFRYDGQPKFPMDFSGKEQNKMPIGAKGVKYLENKWCVLKDEVTDFKKLIPEVSYACSNSDCTSLGFGTSCSNLNERGNFSYAFNIYYQAQDQNFEACNFKGNAHVVQKNASQGNCLFPIQIESGVERLRFSFTTLLLFVETFFISFLFILII